MNILGISCFYHDAGVAVTINGELVAAAQEEWFSRQKHDPSFPEQAITWALDYSGLSLEDIDAIAFYDKPFLKFERLLETYYQHAPQGVLSFLKALPVWIKEKIFLKQQLRKALRELYPTVKQIPQLLFPEHHLSHAASAFYPSPFSEAAILTIDGVGEWATATIAHGNGRDIRVIKELHFPDSLGLLYSAFTYFLGFKVNFGEYKLMGLAPYGNLEEEQTREFIQKIKAHLIDLKADGSLALQRKYFTYATGDRMIDDQSWQRLFGFPRRTAESKLEQKHCNLALAIQKVTEEVVLKMAATAAELTGSDNLCLAGGVALNCVANGVLLRENIFKNIWIQPAAGDAGGAVGAALAAHHIYFEKDVAPKHAGSKDGMRGAYLGPEYSQLEIEKVAKKYTANYTQFPNGEELNTHVASLLAQGNIVGWYQGRQEFGPRALGNRSILGDPRNPEMQRTLNLKIKFREGFRPFAPSVLAEDVADYFDLEQASPYMLLVAPVKASLRQPLPTSYATATMLEKISSARSTIPAVTHVDFSARVQTVHADTNSRYYELIKAFKQQTGCGMLVNTSFNVRGEPVVCTPEHAYQCFMRTHMDVLVMGNYVFLKSEQLPNEKTAAIQTITFKLD